jgi:hypothetical protein
MRKRKPALEFMASLSKAKPSMVKKVIVRGRSANSVKAISMLGWDLMCVFPFPLG